MGRVAKLLCFVCRFWVVGFRFVTRSAGGFVVILLVLLEFGDCVCVVAGWVVCICVDLILLLG